MTGAPYRRRILGWAGLSLALLALGFVAAFGTAGWVRFGERLWIAMADGAWATCF